MKKKSPEELELLRLHEKSRLTPIEQARLYEKLLRDGTARSQLDLAGKIGMSQGRVSQRLALLKLPKAVQELITGDGEGLGERHAKALHVLADAKLMVWMARHSL